MLRQPERRHKTLCLVSCLREMFEVYCLSMVQERNAQVRLPFPTTKYSHRKTQGFCTSNSRQSAASSGGANFHPIVFLHVPEKENMHRLDKQLRWNDRISSHNTAQHSWPGGLLVIVGDVQFEAIEPFGLRIPAVRCRILVPVVQIASVVDLNASTWTHVLLSSFRAVGWPHDYSQSHASICSKGEASTELCGFGTAQSVQRSSWPRAQCR